VGLPPVNLLGRTSLGWSCGSTMAELDLEQLRRIEARAERLLRLDYDCMHGFWNPGVRCFHTNAKALKEQKVSVTNTCFGLFTLLRRPGLLRRLSAERNEADLLYDISKRLLHVEWNSAKLGPFNMYTTPIVLAALFELRETKVAGARVSSLVGTTEALDKVTEGLQALLKVVDQAGAVKFAEYDPSAYLTYWGYRALAGASVVEPIDQRLRRRCRKGAQRVADWAQREVDRQVTFKVAGDSASFDATQLAYALQTHVMAAAEKPGGVNPKVLATAVETVFSGQKDDGLWPKSHAIFHYTEIGSVYTFTCEMLDIFLRVAERFPDVFGSHVGSLEKVLSWSEANRREEGALKGWRSNHLDIHGGPEAWSTAAVFLAIGRLATLARHLMTEQVLSEFRAVRYPSPNPDALGSRFYDSQVPGGQLTSLRKLLRTRLVEPHIKGPTGKTRWSAVLHGPPGTGKTTIGKKVAEALGWPFIYLQTSDFAAEGIGLAVGKAKPIFDKLGLLRKAVVFFDEVDEFLRDREDREATAQNRVVTTAMLSLIEGLRRKEGVIFIVATNDIMRLDYAIKRGGGRFDWVVPVGPPSLAEKRRMFRDRVQREEFTVKQAGNLVSCFNGFVTAKSCPEGKYFTTWEWGALIDEVLEQARATGDVTSELLKEIVRRRSEAITLRDKLREKFEETKTIIRLM